MAITIAVVEQKGGVGKTTIAGHIAGELARRGDRVLMIDTDPQGSLSRLVGMVPEDGLYRWLVDLVPAADVIKPVPSSAYDPGPEAGALMILPSHTQTYGIPFRTQDPFVMMERVAELDDLFNVIVIDTAPTRSMLDATIYLAPDYFLYVTLCEPLSLAGLREGIDSVKRYSKRRASAGKPDQAILGIVPNMMRANTSIHRALIAELGEVYGPLVWTPLMLRTAWPESSAFGQLIYAYKPGDPMVRAAADEARQLVDRVEEALNVGV